jgi:hypothetical protein
VGRGGVDAGVVAAVLRLSAHAVFASIARWDLVVA